MDQRDELLNALPGLLDGPIVADTGDQCGHFGVRPAECEVMAIERVGYHLPCRHPYGHARVVVQQLVERERQVSVRRSPDVVQTASRGVRVQHLPEHLHARAVAQELAGREEVTPERHAVLDWPVVVADLREALARYDVQSLPLHQSLGEPLADLRTVVVLGPRRAVASDPLVPAALARLRSGLHSPLVDDREELLAHSAGLGLRLDLVAVDHPAAVAVGAVPVPASYRARELLVNRPDDLERADAARGSRTTGAIGQQPDAGAVGGEAPVRRQRHEAVAVRAGDRTRPEVVRGDRIRLGLGREIRGQTFLSRHHEAPCQLLERRNEPRAVCGRPFYRRAHDQRGDGVQVVGHGSGAEPQRLERDAPASGGRIEHGDGRQALGAERGVQPVLVGRFGSVLERSRIAVSLVRERLPLVLVRVALEPFSTLTRRLDPASGSYRVSVNPEHAQELLPVGIRRQQRRKHRRA